MNGKRITQLISRQLETTIHQQIRRMFCKPHISEMNEKNVRLDKEYPLVFKFTDRVKPLTVAMEDKSFRCIFV